MISLFTSFAEKWYARRWRFFVATGITFVLITASAMAFPKSPTVMLVAGILSGPAISISWGLFLACVGFHPVHGKINYNPSANRILAASRALTRGYAALFLSLWFVFGVIAWPAFAIYALWPNNSLRWP